MSFSRATERVTFKMEGLKELQDLFAQLPKTLNNDKMFNKFFRENSKPLIKEARANLVKEKADKTGRLKRSIGYFTTKKSKKFLGGFVGPRVKGAFGAGKNRKTKDGKKQGKSGFYGAWIEYGDEVMFYGRGPMKRAKKYFEPAFKTTKGIMLKNTFKDAEKVIERSVKSYARRTQKFGIFGR
tara:strand:+ start:342 stop:890 length:549 start_codon:yes stop_codon:yes gene_type:complete